MTKALEREQAFEKGSIPTQGNAQRFCCISCSSRITFQMRALAFKCISQAPHDSNYELIGLLYSPLRVIHKTSLNGDPPRPKFFRELRRKKRLKRAGRRFIGRRSLFRSGFAGYFSALSQSARGHIFGRSAAVQFCR